MMERYREVKRQHPGSMLLFRMGDFYELFYQDAELAAKLLGLTLTSRDKGSPNPVPMAGFPYHALDNYLQKLIDSGQRAAICDQVEDPRKAKGLVRREVTRVVTPGTLTDDQLLDPRQHNYLACVFTTGQRIGLAWLELSTGRFQLSNLAPEALADELARLQPAECLVPESDALAAELQPQHTDRPLLITRRPDWCFAQQHCLDLLLAHFGTRSLQGFAVDETAAGVTAAGALLEYVQETQKSALSHIARLEPHERGENLVIDEATRRSLELSRTIREGSRAGSLLDVMDQTVSSMGARLFADWLSNPLTDERAINTRLDAVEEFTTQPVLRTEVRNQLDQTYDLQRLTARVATGRASPRDLGCLSRTLALLPELKLLLSQAASPLIQQLEQQLDLCPDVLSDIDAALVDEPPLLTTDGGMIRDGYHHELDQQRALARGGKEWIAAYQAREIERSGITNLKVGFNKVFGYYLEVTAANKDKVPEDYIRKQTLKNQERFVTPELKEHEDEVLQSEERAVALERELFEDLRNRVAANAARLQVTAEVLANTDVLTSLSMLATQHGYCRPEITGEPMFDVREGRHPVLDHLQPSGEFVPNDLRMGCGQGRVQLITGPNMAGKSTYIRQAALISIMAQMGSFVPASEARIGIADRVFARVGASDELGKGQSTFMVEMIETARILNTATRDSLVILDEIGRGTSTYDGISLAWAVTEHLHDRVGCRTLFATHYHELTELTQTLTEARNWNVAVRENQDDVIFLHKILPGTADKSYGIHVARLAGVPADVVTRARVILAALEDDHLDDAGRPTIPRRDTGTEPRQLSLFGSELHPLLDDIRQMDLDQMTPLSALAELHRLRDQLSSSES